MESEEAIMENENNSNLESESNIRDRDHQLKTNEGFEDTVASYLTEPLDAASAEVLWGNRDLSLPAQNLNTDSMKAYNSSSTTPKEPAFDKQGAINFEIEEYTEIPVPSTSGSAVRDKCVSDNEDYFGSGQMSSHQINVQPKDSENIAHELANDESQEYKDFQNSRSEEDMEVDRSRLDPVEGITAGFVEYANEDQPIGSDNIVEPDFCTQPLVIHERGLINDQEILEDSARFDLSGSISSRNIDVISSNDKNWDDDVDLLEEDSMDFISLKDSVAKEGEKIEMSIHALSVEESAFKGVCEEFEDDVVNEGISEPSPGVEKGKQSISETEKTTQSALETEITEQSALETEYSTSQTVFEKSPKSFVSAHLKVSELLIDEDNDLEETSQPAPSLKDDVCSDSDGKDDYSEEAKLHQKSGASFEECTNVTFNTSFSETNVMGSFATETLRYTDSDVTENLRDTGRCGAESIDVTYCNVTEDVNNESDEILSLHDDKLEIVDPEDDDIQASKIKSKPESVSSGINIFLKKNESCISRHSDTSEHSKLLDSLLDEAAKNTCIISKENIRKGSFDVVGDVITEPDETTSYKHSKDLCVDEAAMDECSLSKDYIKEENTEVQDITTEPGHTTSSRHLGTEYEDRVSEEDMEDTTAMVTSDANLCDDTTTLENLRQSEVGESKNISGEVREDVTMMVDDVANIHDKTPSTDHPTQFDAGVQKENNFSNESVDSSTLLMDNSDDLSDHTISCENKKQLGNTYQDKNTSDDDGNEETTKAESTPGRLPGHTTSFEHPKCLDDDTNIKTGISEDNVLEDTKDVGSPSSSAVPGEAASSEHQKDTLMCTSIQSNNSTGKETVNECVGSSQSEDETLDNSYGIDPHPDTKSSIDVLHGEDEIIQIAPDSMEVTGNNSLTPQADETVEPKENSSQSLSSIGGFQRMGITDELSEKDKVHESGVVDDDDNKGASTSQLSFPSTNISKEELLDDVKENNIKSKRLVTNAREVKEDKVVQLKTESAPSKRAKQRPDRSRRSNSVKDKIADANSDNDIKIVSVRTETVKSKAAENGLDGFSVSEQQYHLQNNADKSTVSATSKDNKKTESSKSKSSKSKVQTCLVCQKICKCKYNIVRNGDVKHLCDDACFKQFRKTPSVFLKSNDNVKPSKKSAKAAQSATAAKDTLVLYQQEMESREKNNYKTCAVCQLLNLNINEPFCNWKGLDFCGESCLGKFQANLNTSCSFCHAYIPLDMRATCCIKIGNDMRPFCKQRCYNEFKKKLRLCSFCQRDVAGVSGAFTAMVGTEGKFKEFCSQTCMKQLENEVTDFEILGAEKGSLKPETGTCSICRKRGSLKYTVQFQGKGNKLCSDICLSAFKYANKINMATCDNCRNSCTSEEVQAHFVHYEGQMKHFCSDSCVSLFRKANSKVVLCAWCGSKKLNFDMIEKNDGENVLQVFCSLNCLSLHRVNLQAKSGQVVSCDQCRKAEPAQYHLTMSDASVRNFCSYSCVMTFQSHFASKYTSPGSGLPSVVPSPQVQPQQPEPLVQQPQMPVARTGRGRMNTRQAAARQMSPTVPVISSVVSLAVPHAVDQMSQSQPNIQPPPPTPPQVPPQQSATGTTLPAAATAGNMMPSADGKHQILIQAAPPKSGKNKSSQCRPVTQTKSTSCRPHTQSRDTQTDEIAPKCVMVPIPVPIYIPVPTVMFSAPAPKLVPFPIPIPVPIFIPTTRKSANGISKAIQEIVERMPSDPLEAELLMMAEAVAADRRPGDSDTDSEADTGAEDFGVSEEEVIPPVPRQDDALMLRKREGQGEEDMIQMALRMAEEMSGPIEDLETSVEPVAVNSETASDQQPHQSIQSYESQVDGDYIPSRSSQRGAKRPSRGRPPTSRVKRQRLDRSYNEDDSIPSEHSAQLQSMEPPPDVNYRLKFTYGVNAWRHWVVSKNAQIEKTRQMTGSYRLRPFSTDILKCTTEELNYTLCMFIKEVRKPNGDEYSPDSIYYLCLGIQQYLYENSRIDNIFTDAYFEKFTDSLNDILKTLQPKVNSQGQMLCRIEEEHMWESKQLGAHSPFILLNTLIYFHTKHFILKTAQEHMALSFAQILKHWKKGMPLKGQSAASGKNVSLRFYCLANGKKDGLAARKNKDGVPVYEVTENFDNPLRCPVKLYEFFLSKCPESIKNRNDIFYPVPERSCVPDSPVWYSTQSIDVHTMDKMLTRVLLVREIQEAHLHAQPIYM